MTDIMNCLSLINYYLPHYNDMTVIMRTDSKELFEYYVTDKPNVTGMYFTLNDLTCNFENILKAFSSDEYDFLFHGYNDYHRTQNDPYREVFGRAYDPHRDHFIKFFYTLYNIPYITRMNCFNFIRNKEREKEVYNEFVEKHGTRYAIYHDNPTPGISHREINLPDQGDVPYINLNLSTSNMLEMLQVIERSIGDIHVIDSVWCSLCLLYDYKTKFLKDRRIYIHPFLPDYRSGGCLVDRRDSIIEPVHPQNWNIISC